MRNEFVEMLVLCWKPGQRTPIHDHNGSHGAVFIHEGVLWETTFEYDPVAGLTYKAHRELRGGGLTGFRRSGHSSARQSRCQRTGPDHDSHLRAAARRAEDL